MATVSNRSKPKRLQIVTPEEELENLKNEVGVLRRAVESKSAAVGILRAELQECQKERDKFRTLAEQGGSTALHRPPAHTPAKATLSDPGRSAMLSGGDSSGLAQLLCQAKEESRFLRQEATELKCRLHDAQADIKVLREEVQRWQGGGECRRGSQANTALTQLALQERERFISQMEELSAKCQALEGDVRGLVEEREELVRELDATHHKLHRLNYILNTILSSPQYSSAATTTTTTTASPITVTPTPPRRIVDLDAIITENRYLQQRLKQVEEEMILARSNSSKYKLALERCRTQGSVRLGTSESLIVTPKQVSELLQEYRGEVGGPAESDLRSLCVALVDALGQRSRALRTQRSANRVLVDRVNELERRLMDQGGQRTSGGGGEGGHKGEATPGDLPLAAQELMEGYTPPAGRGGLAWVKEEDASCDPRLSRFLGPLLASQSAHPRDTGGGRDGEVQVNGGKEDLSEKWTEKCMDSENQTNVENRVNRDEVGDRNQMNEEVKMHDGCAEDEIEERDKEEEEEEEEETPLLPDSQQPQTFTDDDALEEIVPLDQLDAYIKDLHMSRRRKAQKGKEEIEDKRSVKEEWKEMEADKRELERTRRETDSQTGELGGDRKETKGGGGVERERKEEKEQKETETRKEKNETVNNELQTPTTETADKISEENSDDDDNDDESFDLDLSDYDSDNDKLDLELEEWRNDCGGGKPGVEGMSPVQGGNKKAKGGKREGFRLWKKDQKSGADEVELPSALQALLDKAAAATSMDSSSSGWTM